jgi:hypothetical protein
VISDILSLVDEKYQGEQSREVDTRKGRESGTVPNIAHQRKSIEADVKSVDYNLIRHRGSRGKDGWKYVLDLNMLITAPISPDWGLYESVVYVYTTVALTWQPHPETAGCLSDY